MRIRNFYLFFIFLIYGNDYDEGLLELGQCPFKSL